MSIYIPSKLQKLGGSKALTDKLIDYVGIGSGSDFDGVSGILPNILKDVATSPNLIADLLDRGYSEYDIKKLLSGNILRVWQQVEEYAANYKSS